MPGRALSRISGLALLLALPLLCAAEARATTTVRLWHAYRGAERAGLEQVAATFNARSKAISLELLPIPYDAFADKITASVPRGKGPDLFIFAQDRLDDWAASGLIEPVEYWVDPALARAYLPPTLDALRYDGQAYGLPLAFKTVALFYRRDMIDAPPADTRAMVEAARALTDAAAGRFGLAYENTSFYYQGAWLLGFGGRVFDADGQLSLTSPEVLRSMRFAQALARESGVMPKEINASLVTSLFNQGRVAMVINGPWFVGEIEPGVDYGIAPLPRIAEIDAPARPFLTVEGVLMSARSEVKLQAFEVMRYLSSAEAGQIMATVGRQTAANRGTYTHPQVASDPVLSAFRAQLESALPMPNTPAMRMVWSPATTAMKKIIDAGEAPESVMKSTQAEIRALLEGGR